MMRHAHTLIMTLKNQQRTAETDVRILAEPDGSDMGAHWTSPPAYNGGESHLGMDVRRYKDPRLSRPTGSRRLSASTAAL